MSGRREHASFEDADAALEVTLDELDANVPNYNEWLRSLIEPAALGRVLEVGAGVGTFTGALLRTADSVVAVEPSLRGFERLEKTAHADHRITPVHGYASALVGSPPFDGAVLSNVLEHIEDDVATLAELATLVRPGGLVAVFSPAFQLLMSRFDRSIGHVRRYRLTELREKFATAGMDVVEARYVNLPGFFAWLLVTRVLNRRPTSSRLSRIYDVVVVPPTRWIERKVAPPFGQSVLVIGRVRDRP